MLTPLIGDILLTHGTHVSMIYIMLRRLGLTPSLVGWSVLILTLMTKICRKNMLELYLLCQVAAVWKRTNNHEKKSPSNSWHSVFNANCDPSLSWVEKGIFSSKA